MVKYAKIQLLGDNLRLFDAETGKSIQNLLVCPGVLWRTRKEAIAAGYMLRQEDNMNYTLPTQFRA